MPIEDILSQGIGGAGIVAAAPGFVWHHDGFARRSAGNRSAQSGSEARVEPGPQASIGKGAALVLIVDDDAAVREAVRLVLPRRYDLIDLPDGGEFMNTVEAYEPDLIILDVHMPGEDGLSLCRRLRARPEFSHIPVLFLTVMDEKACFLKLLEVHGDAYLPKPFDPASLVDTVERLLGGPAFGRVGPGG